MQTNRYTKTKKLTDNTYEVVSTKNNERNTVTLTTTGEETHYACTCDRYTQRHLTCKHIKHAKALHELETTEKAKVTKIATQEKYTLRVQRSVNIDSDKLEVTITGNEPLVTLLKKFVTSETSSETSGYEYTETGARKTFKRFLIKKLLRNNCYWTTANNYLFSVDFISNGTLVISPTNIGDTTQFCTQIREAFKNILQTALQLERVAGETEFNGKVTQ